MSKKIIMKESEAIVCDACEKEIEKGKEYCYHYLVTTDPKQDLNGKKLGVTHYWFLLQRKIDGDITETRYDFHADCLDEIINKFLMGKSK
jgi:hypothetical protein